MSIDELKELLKAGSITQEQFDAMAKAIDPNYSEEAEQPKEEADTDEPGSQQEDVEKLIQRAVDRATNKLGNENKKLRQQIETIKKTKLTEDEAAEMERKEREAELEERERALLEKENRLYAIKAIKRAGLDDGSDKALALIDFVIADSEEDIDAIVDPDEIVIACVYISDASKCLELFPNFKKKIKAMLPKPLYDHIKLRYVRSTPSILSMYNFNIFSIDSLSFIT